jgi:Uma2 family endonuclease
MATQPQTATISLDDFIAAAEATDERIEFVDGQIVALAGTSLEHGLIVSRVGNALANQLVNRPCEVVSQGTLVRAQIGDNAFLPDVVVYCGEPDRERYRGVDLLLNPVLLVEVLSSSTEDYDHGKKWENYRRISTLQDYLLISQTRRRVERYSRQGDGFWLFSETLRPDEEIRIEALGVTLRLDELYGGVLPHDAVPGGANHSGEG